MSGNYSFDDLGLATLPPDTLVPPECRMKNAGAVVNLVNSFIQNDTARQTKRGNVDGLVDGNPPFGWNELRRLGLAKNTNINFGTGRAFLESGISAFWDLYDNAAGHIEVETGHGNSENRTEWSAIMSEELDAEFRTDRAWPAQVQLSQGEMVLHGTGPLFFEDSHSMFPKAIPSGSLLLPDLAESDLDLWEIAVVLFDYYPTKLYEFIMNEDGAQAIGWRTNYTKRVIANAMDQKSPDGRTYNWEWLQNQLKTNSFNDMADQVHVCRMAHVFWREFPQPGQSKGRITHAIVERTGSTAAGIEYCFLHVGRFKSFWECIHPMYYDRGRGGLHYNVTGLGVKMFGPMHLENVEHCRLADQGMAPKMLFKTTTQEAFNKTVGVHLSDFGLLHPGVEVVQNPMGGFISESLALLREHSGLMRSNLSQYRQPVQPDRPGNPATAFEKRMEASQQSSLSNTIFSQNYKQFDALYTEISRRAFNLNTTDERAIALQKRCVNRGVPRECFGSIREARAVRVIGSGSPFMSAQATQEIMQIGSGLPEDGVQNLKNDYIAARAGRSGVRRYNPAKQESQSAADQKERVSNQIGNMRQGMPPVFSPTQNAIAFAGGYLLACSQAIESLQKGGNPREVSAFLDLCGPAAHAHIQRLSGDPLRHQIAEDFTAKWKRIAALAEKLKTKLAQEQKQKQEQQGKTAQVMSDAQLNEFKVKHDAKLKELKLAAQLRQRAQQHQQGMAINDSRAASDISLNRFRALNEN